MTQDNEQPEKNSDLYPGRAERYAERYGRAISTNVIGTEDIEALVKTRLELAQGVKDEVAAEEAHLRERHEEVASELTEATIRLSYWESMLQKLQDRIKPVDIGAGAGLTSSGVLQSLIEDPEPVDLEYHHPESVEDIREPEPAQKVVYGHLKRREGEEAPMVTTPINVHVSLPEGMAKEEFQRRLVEAGNRILEEHESMGQYR